MYGIRLAHRPTRADRFKPGRWAHPSRSKQLHTMNKHAPNGIRAHNDLHTLANDPGNLHAMSNHTTHQGAPTPGKVLRIYLLSRG